MNLSKLTRNELKSAVIGMTLGDACLYIRPRCINAILQMAHSRKVRDYVEWKGEILKQIPGVKYYVSDVIHYNRKLDKRYPQVRASTSVHPLFTKLRKRIYRGRKSLTKGLLSGITPLGLALWYMDDGHLGFHYNVSRYSTDSGRHRTERSVSTRIITLHTQNFTEHENDLIRDWFAYRWGINCKVKKSRDACYLWMNTTNSKKFVDIVREYILPVKSMHYKIDFKYVSGSTMSKQDSSKRLKYNIEYWTKAEQHERLAPGV